MSNEQRDVPFRLNFEQQKKRAKELLKRLKNNDKQSIDRAKKHLHKIIQDTDFNKDIRLSDCQFIIARELRLVSWAKLKAHIQRMDTTRKSLTKMPPLDTDLSTLHIRCGSDIQMSLPTAGLHGDFLEYSDPVCQGPLIKGEQLLKARAEFLSNYVKLSGVSIENIEQQLQSDEEILRECADNYQRVVLWFEHDIYDQLILARVLACFSTNKVPVRLEIVSVNDYPGSTRFVGLGQLPPEALHLLWQKRVLINEQQLSLGHAVWDALCSSDFLNLHSLLNAEKTNVLPYMAQAIKRYLQELPSVDNGLGLCENLILQALVDKSYRAGKLFSYVTGSLEPTPWLGDIMFWHILKKLSNSAYPVIRIEKAEGDKSWHLNKVSITQTGIDVFYKHSDWLNLNQSDDLFWRWNESQNTVVKRSAAP